MLRGESERQIKNICDRFIDSYLNTNFRTAMVEALHKHQRNGDEVYLVSSNFAFMLHGLERVWKPFGVIATDVEIIEGRFTGRLVGRACDGPEKLGRVLAAFGTDPVRQATAYGDSRSDRYLIDFVKDGIWV
jgi:phosphoserine phosphatase